MSAIPRLKVPWQTKIFCFRPVKGVRGFSRETVIALMANIESQEFQRRQTAQTHGTPEHPRASSSDDVECFFSILHNHLGQHYDVKTIQQRWRPICNEFLKRINPDLTFFYYTSDKNRYRIHDLPSFDVPSEGGKSRLDLLQPTRREDVGQMVVGRATMPVRGFRTVRQQYHSQPADLPQPPNRS